MKIREDFIGCVFAGGHHLFAGDDVPENVLVADWLIAGMQAEKPESSEKESTEIVIEDDELVKPTRADNKADWFTYADSLGAIEENATIDDYSKADLIELVG